MQLRVIAYNVRGFRDGLDRPAAIVSRFEPDLALLNETGGRLALRRFGRAVGMQVAGDPWSPFRRRVKDAVLVRSPWRIASSAQRRFPTASRLYPRGALVVEMRRAGVRMWAVAAHLGLHPGERRRHAEELAELVRPLRGPVVIGGDLNEPPDGQAATFLAERLWDAWLLGGDSAGETFPADEPAARIDYVFVSEGLRVERAMVPGGAAAAVASDHRPVVALLTLPPD